MMFWKSFLSYILILFSVLACSKGDEQHQGIEKPDYAFDGSISERTLRNYLNRAITAAEICVSPDDMLDTKVFTLEDDIRLIRHTGAKFIGRAIFRWGNEEKISDGQFLPYATNVINQVHSFDPDVIFQAAIFEIVTRNVNQISVPEEVFQAFDIPVEERNFIYDSMLFQSGSFVDYWAPGRSVPDIRRMETRIWLYFLATSYIDAGFEAIHWGQVDLMGKNDARYEYWFDLLGRVRVYASTQSRRHFVLHDAHAPKGGFRQSDALLMDFHSFPLRIAEKRGGNMEGQLLDNFKDAMYGKSMGGVAPSGWSCNHLPYLVEFDNFGISNDPGQYNLLDNFIWGYDEISWFSLKSESEQSDWLRYAYDWIRKNDPDGFLQMPVTRVVTNGVTDNYKYKANVKSASCPQGTDLELTIKALWE